MLFLMDILHKKNDFLLIKYIIQKFRILSDPYFER